MPPPERVDCFSRKSNSRTVENVPSGLVWLPHTCTLRLFVWQPALPVPKMCKMPHPCRLTLSFTPLTFSQKCQINKNMEIFYTLNKNPNLSLALGFFDGVHLAHKKVLGCAVDFARENNTKSAVVTFKDHPLCHLRHREPEYIVSLKHRLEMLENTGIDFVYVLDFDDKIAQLDANGYLERVLIDNFSPKALTTGFNHFFGMNKTGHSLYLKKNQEKFGYKYFEIALIEKNSTLISSSNIRYFLNHGDITSANELLGYNFFLEGTVIEGEKIGKSIGFPTANFNYPETIIKIPTGVYGASVELQGKRHKAILNYGKRPTISTEEHPIVEVHILDFDGNIYGQAIKVDILNRIRAEQKFNSLNELKQQIASDIKFIV